MNTVRGLSVLVTGGSRGLGLLLARRCRQRGCAVTVAARDRAELDRALELLDSGAPGAVTGRVCDVRDEQAVQALVADTAREQGGLDVVLANAGVIQVGPAESMGTAAFRDAMETMFFGGLHTSLASLPYLRESPAGGRLGLVGSVGGLLPVPHLVPYSCAKSAIASLAEGLRTERAGHGVDVTEIHPGLMRTGSHLQAEFGGDARREYSWFATLAGLPGLSMDAERAAERIVTALERRRRRVVLTPVARVGATAHGVAPVLVSRVNSGVARLLPDAPPAGDADRAPEERRTGAEIARAPGSGRARWQTALSALNERAARRFNETGGPRTPGKRGRPARGRAPEHLAPDDREPQGHMTQTPADLASLLRHFEDLREHTHGHAPESAAEGRQEKERIYERSTGLLDPVARNVLEEMNAALLHGTGEVRASGVLRDEEGGLDASWTLSWAEQQRAGVGPVRLSARYGARFHHPHLCGGTVGHWPLNVFTEEQAAAETGTLRAVAAADLHNLVFRADYRIVPAAQARQD